jgi:hypothetical protein
MFFVPGGRSSTPQQVPAPLYASNAAPARFSWRRKTLVLVAALFLDDLNLAALDGFLNLVQIT